MLYGDRNIEQERLAIEREQLELEKKKWAWTFFAGFIAVLISLSKKDK